MTSVAPAIRERLERLAQQWQPTPEPELFRPQPPVNAPQSSIPRLDRRSWRVLLVLAAVASVVVGWVWWQGRAHAVVPIADRVVASSSSSSPAALTGTTAVVVHVVGAVHRPGLVTLAAGSRVADALKAAGGATSTKAEGSVNLARLVLDGEQIHVNAAGAAITASGIGKVSVNSATAQELESLPGVGPVLAQRMLEYRASHGPFRSVEDLDDVSGIGSALMGQLRAHVQM